MLNHNVAFSWCFYPFYLLPLPFLLQTVIIIIYSCCRGLPVGRKGQKKEKDPFREAFGRVKDMRSVLPGIPVLALTASVQVTERAKLMKTCGMHKPVTVDVSPNKENIAFNFISIPNEKDAVTHLKWIADMVVEKGKECPQTIVFCNTFNDISAVLSYLLLVLKDKAFTEGPNGKKAPLLSVYHAKTWEAQKMAIEEDFKSDGLKRVVIATCALGMGINFPKVQYVVQYGPPTSIVDLMQQAGRGGRDGRQAHCITYFTKRQLSRCGKEVKSVVKTDKCQREALYSHFSDSISCLSPGHLCCSNCRKQCECSTSESKACDGNSEVFLVVADNHEEHTEQGTSQGKTRNLTATDKTDLRLALLEMQSELSTRSGSFFDSVSSHGFTERLVDDIVKASSNIFSFEYLQQNFSIYSTQHAMDVLEIFQELFEDIPDFAQQMEVLGLLNSEVTQAEKHIQTMELSSWESEHFSDDSDELNFELPEFDIHF